MTPKQLAKIKEEYFRVQSLRTGIPVEYYELPAEVIKAYEDGQAEAAARERLLKDRGIEPKERVQEYPGRLCPRLARRPVGDFSLLEVDGLPDWY